MAQSQSPPASRDGGPSGAQIAGGSFKKSHLIELMPMLSDLILRNE